MDQTNLECSFDNCKNMIYKLANTTYHTARGIGVLNAHKTGRVKRTDLELDDLIGEAMLIYSRCLVEYKGSKGMKFTTYLYMNLKQRLIDYCNCTMKKIELYEDYAASAPSNPEDGYEQTIQSLDYDLSEHTKDILKDAKDYLSYEAVGVLKYLLTFDWVDAKHKNKPADAQIRRQFGYPQEVVNSIMGEIGSYWNKRGYKVAA